MAAHRAISQRSGSGSTAHDRRHTRATVPACRHRRLAPWPAATTRGPRSSSRDIYALDPPMSGVDRCRMLVLPTTPPPYRPAPKVRQPISAPHDDQIPIAQATARTPRFPPSRVIRRAGRLTSGFADRSVFGRRPARRITLNESGPWHRDRRIEDGFPINLDCS